MRASSKHGRARFRTALVVAGMMAAGFVGGWAPAQQPGPAGEKPAPPAKAPTARPVDQALDQKINQAKEEIELMELQVETRKAQLRLAEARLAEARRWRDRFEKMFRDGFASEERFIAARDDVLMHESRVAWDKAAVHEAELRVKQARRRLDYGEFPLMPQESRTTELEQRMTALEKNLDLLQQEVGNLRRMVRQQWKMPDNVERPAVTPAPR